MNLAEYQKRAARTLLAAPTQPLTDQEIMLNWCLVGLVGELWELIEAVQTTPINCETIKKEFGDVNWYAAGVFTVLEKDFGMFVGGETRLKRTALIDALGIACSALEQYKKEIFHRHGLDVAGLLLKIWLCITIVKKQMLALGISWDITLTENITKLEVRYPTGFNTQDSIKRVDVEHAQS